MGHENEGDSRGFLDFFQFLLHILAKLQVQRAQRLIQKKNLRFVDQRPGDCNTLLLTAGQAGDTAVGKAGQHNHVQHFIDLLLDLLFGQLSLPQGEGDVFKHIQVREQGVFLEDRIDVALVGRDIVDAFSHENHIALIRVDKAADDSQGCSFSAAGGAQKGNKLIVMNIQTDIVQNCLSVKGFGDVFQFNNFVHLSFLLSRILSKYIKKRHAANRHTACVTQNDRTSELSKEKRNLKTARVRQISHPAAQKGNRIRIRSESI